MRPRKIFTELAAISTGIALLYGVAYLVSVQKFEGYCGSMPINDPTWHLTVDASPNYRFLPAAFWTPAHRLDRALRPEYWRFAVTAPSSAHQIVIGPDSLNVPMFSVPPPTLLERVFPTLGEN